MQAFHFGTFHVQVKRMLLNDKTTSLGDLLLTAFDFLVEKLFNVTTVDAYQMVMVLAGLDLEYRLARFEMVAFKQTRLFELGQYAINGGQPDIHVFAEQHAIDIIGTQVAYRGLFEKLENLEAGVGGFEPHAL